jgi:hypothetical protein
MKIAERGEEGAGDSVGCLARAVLGGEKAGNTLRRVHGRRNGEHLEMGAKGGIQSNCVRVREIVSRRDFKGSNGRGGEGEHGDHSGEGESAVADTEAVNEAGSLLLVLYRHFDPHGAEIVQVEGLYAAQGVHRRPLEPLPKCGSSRSRVWGRRGEDKLRKMWGKRRSREEGLR